MTILDECHLTKTRFLDDLRDSRLDWARFLVRLAKRLAENPYGMVGRAVITTVMRCSIDVGRYFRRGRCTPSRVFAQKVKMHWCARNSCRLIFFSERLDCNLCKVKYQRYRDYYYNVALRV